MPSVPEELPALNEYDDNSFIEDRNCSRLQPADVTCAPSLPATDERGYHFQLLHISTRALRVKELPNAPIDFFLSFIPYSLVERWVQYTNSWVTGADRPGVGHVVCPDRLAARVYERGRGRKNLFVPQRHWQFMNSSTWFWMDKL
jgi:hypothetical protein